jgi:RNA polymerase sigma-70 factor (ECF subfamily)
MVELSPQVLERALAREPHAVRALVGALTPLIQVRVARAVMRLRSTRVQNRNPAEEVRDLTQEVFAALFADDAKALRAWSPSRGLSLMNFVGMVAEHQVANVFRSGKRRPWSEHMVADPELDLLEEGASGPERHFASRELYAALLDRVRAELTPRGFQLFQMMFIDEQSVEAVITATGMSADAVYAWRSRLPKLVRRLASDLERENSMSDLAPVGRTSSKGADV